MDNISQEDLDYLKYLPHHLERAGMPQEPGFDSWHRAREARIARRYQESLAHCPHMKFISSELSRLDLYRSFAVNKETGRVIPGSESYPEDIQKLRQELLNSKKQLEEMYYRHAQEI